MFSCIPRPPTSISPVLTFVFNDTATTEIYTLSLHDALPIFFIDPRIVVGQIAVEAARAQVDEARRDRKSTRLNSSHVEMSYAVFFLKKESPMGLVFCEQEPGRLCEVAACSYQLH